MARKSKDWTTLEAYAGMSWAGAAKRLKGSLHMFAFSKDPETVEAGMEIERAWRETGEEAGMAVFLAHLVLRKSGDSVLAGQAIEMYKEVASSLAANPKLTQDGKRSVELLRHKVSKMEEMAAWASVRPIAFEWPIEFPFMDDLQKKAGMANVMLFLAARSLEVQNGSGILAAAGIVRFFREGMESHEGKTEKRGEVRVDGEGEKGDASGVTEGRGVSVEGRSVGPEGPIRVCRQGRGA